MLQTASCFTIILLRDIVYLLDTMTFFEGLVAMKCYLLQVMCVCLCVCVCACVNVLRVGNYTVMYVFCATQFHYLYDSTAAGIAREREF